MTEGRLKDLEKWARQAVRDNQGNIPKLGESMLELIDEVRRLSGWDGKVHIKIGTTFLTVPNSDISKVKETVLSVFSKGLKPEIYCGSKDIAYLIEGAFIPTELAKMIVYPHPPPAQP